MGSLSQFMIIIGIKFGRSQTLILIKMYTNILFFSYIKQLVA